MRAQEEMSNFRVSRGDSRRAKQNLDFVLSFPYCRPIYAAQGQMAGENSYSSTPRSCFMLFSLQAASQSNLSGKHLASVAHWATRGQWEFCSSPHTFSLSLCVHFPPSHMSLSIHLSLPFSLSLGWQLFKIGPSGSLPRQGCVCVQLVLLCGML